jgi:LmbE family N-acetylglucosaminyl deacetylase
MKEQTDVSIWWVVFSAKGPRRTEAQASAHAFLKGNRKNQVLIKKFKDSFFPVQTEAIKKFFGRLKEQIRPDVVFTHFLEDRHQDHRLLSELTWNTFRNHLICEYEIPKYEGDLKQPNLFMPLEHEICEKKVSNLRRFFPTQGDKHWFSDDLFYGLMRLRGVECASPTKFAEAFHCRKIIL